MINSAHLFEPRFEQASSFFGCQHSEEVLHKDEAPLCDIDWPVEPQQHTRLQQQTQQGWQAAAARAVGYGSRKAM
jgi:hypothetical protein